MGALFERHVIDRLRDQGYLSQDQLNVALNEHKLSQTPLDRIVIDLGYVNWDIVLQHKSQLTTLPLVDIRPHQLPPDLQRCDSEVLQKAQAFPFFYEAGETTSLQDIRGTPSVVSPIVHVAFHDPEDLKSRDQIKKHIEGLLKKTLTLQCFHGDSHHIQQKIAQLSPLNPLNTEQTPLSILESILQDACDKGSSDIHFQPDEYHITVRLRIDGLMQSLCVLHPEKWTQIQNRLKVLGHLDIAETRRAQSGHFRYTIKGHPVDIRVSTHPTLFGENIVLRLLDKTKRVMSLQELGYPNHVCETLCAQSEAPQGMIIITGPTGSGKTTTLYALLASMDVKRRNIMTLEAPIEAILPHIRQTEISENGLMSYANGVRSLLRQDPDVILIGEIRDEETAHIAVRAVLTGHLVLSTMHTQDALSVPMRLIDLGIPASLLEGVLQMVIAQRLVRKLCVLCKGHNQGEGCEQCDAGFKGRTVLVEHMIYGASGTRHANLWDHGLACVSAGITTLAEVKRVLGPPKQNV